MRWRWRPEAYVPPVLARPVTGGLAVAWTASSLLLRSLDEPAARTLRELASTTLPHWYAWPLTLPASGLLVGDDLPVWLLALPLGVGAVEAAVGSRRALALVAGVHVTATLASQALLGARVAAGRVDGSLLHQVDVGPSYLAVAGLVGALVLGGRVRPLAAAALLVGLPELSQGLGRADLAATGHLAAALLALLGAGLLRRRAPTVAG